MPAGTITALRTQAHDNQRVNVFVDDAFAIGVSLNTITREGLYVGKVLDAAAWTRLEEAECADKAVTAALQYLTARPRSTAEVRERLQRKQFPPEAVEAALTRLQERGLIDDTAFSRFWVENRQACRPRGVQALRSELYRKGIDRTTIDATLSDTDLTGDEYEQALTLARTALRKYADAPNYATFQRRLGGYLQRRGFGFDTISSILDLLWQEVQQGDA
jgi:regulatory protein